MRGTLRVRLEQVAEVQVLYLFVMGRQGLPRWGLCDV